MWLLVISTALNTAFFLCNQNKNDKVSGVENYDNILKTVVLESKVVNKDRTLLDIYSQAVILHLPF